MNKNFFSILSFFWGIFILAPFVHGAEIIVPRIDEKVKKPEPYASFWNNIQPVTIDLVAQPIIAPRPEKTTTPELKVKAVHDGDWKDSEKSDGQKVGTFSDAVAIQFPVKAAESPPPVFMGSKEQPVQIFHWRAMFQLDRDVGFHTMRQIYPNMISDGYPEDWGTRETREKAKMLSKLTEEQAVGWSSGRLSGNPQSFRKPNGVDVIFAEGFGSSSVSADLEAEASGNWKNGEWTVVITRPLNKDRGSNLHVGEKSVIAFAVWQGGKREAGSRKSVTMPWTPISINR